jgi:5-methyltetrahydrofolate--homocysteine methyltransferase
VAGSLLSDEQKVEFLKDTNDEYERIRADYANKKTIKEYVTFAEAQKNPVAIKWEGYIPPVPTFLGKKVFDNYDLNEIRKYIDWTPFFITWEMKGRYPQILQDSNSGAEATKLFNDANAMLDRIIAEKWLTAKGVVGFWEAEKPSADTLVLPNPKSDGHEVRLESLRQQIKKAASQPQFSLADFVAPKESGLRDYIGGFAVSIHGIESHLNAYNAAHDDYNKIMLQAIADRLAEAFAEVLHLRTRKEFWAYAQEEDIAIPDLIKEQYRGIRPAPGYPACPDHTEKIKLFDLLDATNVAGITLTESLAMYPAASVCGWYFSHPQSGYFGIGKILKDQLEDYANRKQMSIEEATKWLSPNLEEQ